MLRSTGIAGRLIAQQYLAGDSVDDILTQTGAQLNERGFITLPTAEHE